MLLALPCLLLGVFHHVGDYNLGDAVHMVMQDSLAYFSCRTQGLSILHVADPANPVLLKPWPGTCLPTALSGRKTCSLPPIKQTESQCSIFRP